MYIQRTFLGNVRFTMIANICARVRAAAAARRWRAAAAAVTARRPPPPSVAGNRATAADVLAVALSRFR